jgi:hypothetical protein
MEQACVKETHIDVNLFIQESVCLCVCVYIYTHTHIYIITILLLYFTTTMNKQLIFILIQQKIRKEL